MTIKSFKEQSQVNELGPLAVVPAAVGMAVRAAPAISNMAVRNADKVGAAATVAHRAVKKGVSKVKKFMKKEEKQDESLWANIHKKRERIKRGSGERMRKKGEKGAPKSLNVGEGFASDAQRRAAFASGYKAKGKKEGAMSRIDYSKKSGEKGTGLDTFKKKPVSSDYKPYPKPGKKPLYGDKVAELSRYDLGKKIISTMGTKAPTMLTKHDSEKKKVKTDLARLRKALGPNHAMNKRNA